MSNLPWYMKIFPIDKNETEISEVEKKTIEIAGAKGIPACWIGTEDKSMPDRLAFEITPDSREKLHKLIAIQSQRKDKKIQISVSEKDDIRRLFVSFEEDIHGQTEESLVDLCEDLENLESISIDEELSKNIDDFLGFTNEKFGLLGSDYTTNYGYAYELYSASQWVNFYGYQLEKFITPLDFISEELENAHLYWGRPKISKDFTDEQYDKAAEIWSEGNDELKKILIKFRNLGINTKACCGGHENDLKGRAYVAVNLDSEESIKFIKKLLAIRLDKKVGDYSFFNVPHDIAPMAAFYTTSKGKDEKFFEQLSRDIDLALMIEEKHPNYSTKAIDYILGYVINPNEIRAVNLFPQSDVFQLIHGRFEIYKYNVFENLVNSSNSQEKFNEGMSKLFTKKIDKSELDMTKDRAILGGMSVGKLKSMYKDFKSYLSHLLGPKDDERGN